VARVGLEAVAAEVGLGQLSGLDHRAHGSVDEDNAVRQQAAEVGRGSSLSCCWIAFHRLCSFSPWHDPSGACKDVTGSMASAVSAAATVSCIAAARVSDWPPL